MVTCDRSYDEFDKRFTTDLNKHAQKKKRWLHGNQKPHINETLRDEIMKSSNLKNKVINTKNPSDIINCKNQRSYVVQSNKKLN